MVLKFPSGRLSVSVRDLQENQHSQQSCGICNKPWIISCRCIEDQIRVLHPCQHLVGAGCWSTVPDEKKDKCPVCKVKIQCNEAVRIGSSDDISTRQTRDSVVESFGPEVNIMDIEEELVAMKDILRDKIERSSAHTIIVKNKMRDGLNDIDVRAIMYYMNLRARLDSVKGNLGVLLASTKTVTPTHRKWLVFFLANAPQKKQYSKQRKVEVALSAFNISAGTNFTINDLKRILASAEDWVKSHFAAILDDYERAALDASTIRNLKGNLANAEVGLKELKDRQSRDIEARKAIEKIVSKADADILKIRVEAEKAIAGVHTDIKEKIERIRAMVCEGTGSWLDN